MVTLAGTCAAEVLLLSMVTHADAFDYSCRKGSTAGPLPQGRSLIRTQFNGWSNSHSLLSPEH
jgi:hypothetical protein